MVVLLSQKLSLLAPRVIKRGEFSRREFNAIVKEALTFGAHYWIRNFLPLRFNQSAKRKYDFEPRSGLYKKIKKQSIHVRVPGTSTKVLAPKPPMDLVWTGTLKNSLLNRGPETFNIKAAATATKQRVRIPLPIPFKSRPGLRKDLRKSNRAEDQILHRIMIKKVQELIDTRLAKTTLEA